MKLRNGFVSNSSSASFVIIIKSTLPQKTVEEYIRKSDKHLDEIWDKEEKEIFNGFDGRKANYRTEKCLPRRTEYFKKLDENLYEFDTETSMFNDWRDVAGCLFIETALEGRIKDVDIVKIVSDYGEQDDEIIYDFRPWQKKEIDDAIIEGRKSFLKDDEIKEIEILCKEIEKEKEAYLKYIVGS
jgi:hypothetical protein